MKSIRLRTLLAGSLAASGILVMTSAARAEGPAVRWHLEGGYSEPLGTTADFLEGGYSVGGGLSVSPSALAPLDFRFDLNYSEYNASNRLIASGQQTTSTPINGGTGRFLSG